MAEVRRDALAELGAEVFAGSFVVGGEIGEVVIVVVGKGAIPAGSLRDGRGGFNGFETFEGRVFRELVLDRGVEIRLGET